MLPESPPNAYVLQLSSDLAKVKLETCPEGTGGVPAGDDHAGTPGALEKKLFVRHSLFVPAMTTSFARGQRSNFASKGRSASGTFGGSTSVVSWTFPSVVRWMSRYSEEAAQLVSGWKREKMLSAPSPPPNCRQLVPPVQRIDPSSCVPPMTMVGL